MDYTLLLGVHILKDLSLFSHSISECAFRKAEKKAGPIVSGSYW
jgi:hypothetical protein